MSEKRTTAYNDILVAFHASCWGTTGVSC